MSHDTWIHRIARLGVRPLVATSVTPNQITTLRCATGLAAAGLFAAGSPEARDWGAGLFLFSLILDRADGELARLGGKTSPWGHKFDLVSDTLCNVAAFVGLGIGLRSGALGSWSLLVGLIAGLAIAWVLWFVLKLEERGGERAGELGSIAGFDPDDALLILPLAIWLGFPETLLVAAAIGAPIFTLYFYTRLHRRHGESETASQSKQG